MRNLIVLAALTLALGAPATARADDKSSPLLPVKTFSFGGKDLDYVEGKGFLGRDHYEATNRYAVNGYIYEYTPQGNPNYVCIVTVVRGSYANSAATPSCILKADARK